MTGATTGLALAVFVASLVEFVEALTIVLAMGVTRSWRSALAGVGAAVVCLAAFTAVAGYALSRWLPQSALQIAVGTLLLIFGLQWLRKAILRSAGLKARHDEAEEYAAQTAAAQAASRQNRFGIDTFAFVVSLKGVFLEGVEVVFIVITFGLSAGNIPVAVVAAVLAGLVVVGAGVSLHRPLTAVPENTMKYAVGLMLASFGTYWSVEGLGVFIGDHQSLHWPGADMSILGLLVCWFGLSRIMVAVLTRRRDRQPREPEAVREAMS